MCYFWGENLSKICELIVCGSHADQEYSTDTEGRESIHKHCGIKGMFL